MQDAHANELETEPTRDERLARFEYLQEKLGKRGLGQWNDEHETDEYFILRMEFKGY